MLHLTNHRLFQPTTSGGHWIRGIALDTFNLLAWGAVLLVLSSSVGEKLAFRLLVACLHDSSFIAMDDGTSYLWYKSGEFTTQPVDEHTPAAQIEWTETSNLIGDPQFPLRVMTTLRIRRVVIVSGDVAETDVSSFLARAGIHLPERGNLGGMNDHRVQTFGRSITDYPGRTFETLRRRWPWWSRLTYLVFLAITIYTFSCHRTLKMLLRHFRGACIGCGYNNSFSTCPECGMTVCRVCA